MVGRLVWGSIEDRLFEETGGGGLLDEGVRCLVYPLSPYLGAGFSILWGGKSTDDGGELPGVPAKVVLVKERSAETMLDIDSRNLEFCRVLKGSSKVSRSSIVSVKSRILDDRSLCRRRISPFTVKRSFRPFWMIARTRLMAGP